MPEENYDIWFDSVEKVSYPRTLLPKETEIVIVGGGMAGVTSAYLLAKAGKKVVLLEKRTLGGYVTSATTAFLTFTIDTEPQTLIKKFGEESARLIIEAHKVAIDEIEKIIKTENIDCEFERCTNYIYANDKKEEKYLLKLADGYNKLGVEATYKKGGLKFNEFGYIEMPNHGKFHAIKYLNSLSKLAVKYGAVIAEETDVLSLKDNKGFVEVEVKDVGTIKAQKVVSAVYRPFKAPEHLAHLSNMYVEYVLEYKLPKDKFISGTYEDTRSPYNYFRIDKRDNFDRLVIGGADHMAALKLDHEINHRLMQTYAKSLFNITDADEIRHWSGSMLETNDGLAFIGETNGGNIFYMFGFSGNGMTYSYIAGKILLDQVLSVNNPYSKIYHVDRKISWWKNLFY